MSRYPGVKAISVIMILTALTSCGFKNDLSDVDMAAILISADPAARDEAFLSVQGDLMTDASESAADTLIRNAERKRSVDNGLIREPIDLSAGTIRYYSINASAIMESSMAGDPKSGDLEIVDYGPRGELPVENRRPNIYVMFNRPMVPLAALGAPILESDLLTIEPPVEGVYRWYGTKTLGFRPDRPLQDIPRYRITISDKASSMSGLKLKDDFSFDIFGERVKIVNMFPGNDAEVNISLYDVPTAIARKITLEFNQPVDPEVIGRSIRVIDKNRSFSFTTMRPDYPERLESRTDRGVLLVLNEEPGENIRLKVTLEKGAVPFPGFPASAREQTYQLRTIRPFRAVELSASPGGFPRDNRPFLYPVYLRFSHPLPEDMTIPDINVRVDGRTVEPENIRISWSTMAFYLPDMRPGQDVTVNLPGGIRDIFGREAESVRMATTIPRPYPMVDFPYQYDGLRHLEAEFDPALVWTSRNIVEGRFGVMGRTNFFDQPDYSPPMTDYDLSGAIPDSTFFHQENLESFLGDQGYGTVYFRYEMRQDPSQVNQKRQWRDGEVAVQVTDLGLSVRVAYNRVLVWVNRLSDGQPVSGAEVTVFNLNGKSYGAVTDGTGLASVVIPEKEFGQAFYNRSGTRTDSVHVRAEKGGDLAEMRVQNTQGSYAFGVYNTVNPGQVEEPVDRIHMFTDRGLYKPGEELAFRGIHWMQNPGGFESYSGSYDIRIVEADTGEAVWSQGGRTTESGGFAHRLRLPEDLDPGSFQIIYEGRGARRSASFRIASFRRVAFQVNSSVREGDYYHGDAVEATVNSSYLAGGALPSAGYHYFWTRKPVRYTPPGKEWEDWVFGTSAWAPEQTLSSGDGNLSGAGSVRISEGTIDHEVTGKAYRYTLETTVEDIDRQVVSSITSAVVHPAEYYVAARFDRGSVDGWWSRFVPTGEEVTVLARLTDVRGGRVDPGGALTVGLVKGEWKSASQQGLYGRVNTRWEFVEEELWREEKPLKDGGSELRVSVKDPGRYTLFFIYTDEAGRPARTEIDFYATGSGWVQRASRTPSDINLIVDKSLYEPGDTARILVESPIPKGRYLLTVEREGILEQRIVTLEGSSEIIEIPVKEEYLPVFYVALSGFTERTDTEDDYFEPDLGRPRGLFGLTTVRVATTPVELDVDVESVLESYGPGDEAEIVVRVKRDGRPVEGAEITVLAVDRGVLDLINYHVPNPLDYFYDEYHFPHGVMGDDSRRLLLRPVTYEISNLQGGDSAKLEVRKDFNPLALFEPYLRTGPDGAVRLKMKLPDNLSTYRLTAVALDGVRLGFDEDEFRVSNPINVRTALPRRFRNRDTAAAGVVLTNMSDVDREVTVTADSDILSIIGGARKSLVLPANSTTELPFALEAAVEGEGVIRFTIRSDVLNEILEEKVIVERPLVTEAFATIGIVGDGEPVVETLVIPIHAAEGFGGLSLVVDSTLRPYIEGRLNKLRNIPYPSQNDLLYGLVANLAATGEATGAKEVFGKLADLQFADGGIGYRSPGLDYTKPSWFLSALAAHVLLEISGSETRFDNPVDSAALNTYLTEMLNAAAGDDEVSFLAAWTAWILAENGVVIPTDLSWLYDSEDRLGIAGYNLLSQAYGVLGREEEAGALYDRSRNFITIGTRLIDITETYEAVGYFSSKEAELALMLKTAVLRDEEPELVLRMAGALNGNRNSRRFGSRFDDFWVVTGFMPLLAREARRTNYGLTIDLEDKRMMEGESVRGDFPLAESPLSEMEKGVPLALRIGKDGSGDIYYAATLSYALPTETALPRDEGIEIFSQVETLDGEILDEGNLPLGETLRMRVTLSTLSRRSFLKLVVPVPSGTEIVDPSFSTTGSYGDAGGTGGESWTRETVYGDTATFVAEGYATFGPGAWSFWFYRPIQKVYDNTVTYTWEDFYPGQREITFLIRTTTPGVYPTPPISASLEFEPEVFGRGGGRLAVIRGE